MIIQCKSCHSTTRVQHEQPSAQAGSFMYCPLCSTDQVSVMQDLDGESEWFEYSRVLKIPVKLIKQLYELWSPQTGDPANFFDFVELMKK